MVATAYGVLRTLENPLTFAYISLDRRAGGARLQVKNAWWNAGIEMRALAVDRLRRSNQGGMPSGPRVLDQHEQVTNTAFFAAIHGPLRGGLRASGALRYDELRFCMTDHLTSNGDQSGMRSFNALSPSLGLIYRGVYANFSTAFETPTTTELVNRPDGMGGFNPDLKPQRTLGFEFGTRGMHRRLRFNAAIFRLHIRDRLGPEEVADASIYYSNRGKSNHHGLEMALTWPEGGATYFQVAYTVSRFIFTNRSTRGHKIPGVPDQYLLGSLRTQRRGFSGEIAFAAASGIWADDYNSARSAAFGSVDVYMGY